MIDDDDFSGGLHRWVAGCNVRQLLEERDELFSFVTDFEQGRVPESEYVVDPSSDVVYQVYLEYLAVLCKRIAEVYNRDYVWGGKED